MGRHILSLRLPDVTNEGILLLDDTSIYNASLPVTCPSLQITPPGYTTPAVIDPGGSGFRLVLSTCSVGISGATDCSQMLPKFPDGIYNIRYSVAPNDQVYVEYKVLRVVKALNRYFGLLCRLNLKPCLPGKDTQEQLVDLDTIYNFIISAKMTVEQAHRFDDGINQLRYANHLMDKMSSSKPFC